MFVYLEHPTNHTIMITPGKEHPETTDFMENGAPKQIQVRFLLGRAEVPSNIGDYMVAKKLAYKLIPAKVKRFRTYVEAD